MGFWDKLLKAEQRIRKSVESAFGQGSAQTPLEIRRDIMEQVEARIVVDTSGSRFPFARVAVLLQPPTEALRDVFEAAFVHDGSLRSDILEKLRDSQARYPPELEIAVEVRLLPEQSAADASPLFKLDFVKADASRKVEVPEVKLTVVKGAAEKPEYRIRKERILVGRLAEVLDREGRLIRKNDVVFLDNEEDINTTVGRIHARIWFDPERREFCIVDEASRYGTRVIREGRSIEVPGGNSRGIRLRSGDEIYLGQACLRFDMI